MQEESLRWAYYGAAVKVLASSGVAPCNDETVAAMKLKHPWAEAPLINGGDVVFGGFQRQCALLSSSFPQWDI